MITVEDWALIRQLHLSEGVPQAQTARQLGLSRNTVARALKSEGPPVYRQPRRSSAFDVYEGRVRAVLAGFPGMPASVIAERLGWAGSESWFRKRVALLRPEYAPKDPADRLEHAPGDQAHCDLWFPPHRVPSGTGEWASFPVLVVVASYSRFITARMLPSRRTPDLLAGMWCLLSGQLGAVPRRLVSDNEAGIGRRNSLAEGVAGFCGSLATRIVQLKPFDPESKGIVERANRFLETSFLPGRRFQDPEDFNAHLAEWLVRANQRTVRALGARPADLLESDRRSMLPLPALVVRGPHAERGYHPKERERAVAMGAAELDRDRLQRVLRAASTASVDEAEFVRRLRRCGVLVRPRFAQGGTGAVAGYSVALRPESKAGKPVWFGGGRIARDLALPQLRKGWNVTDETVAAALVEWQAAAQGKRPTAEGREVHEPTAAEWEKATAEVGQLYERMKTIPLDDAALWAQVARETSRMT
ncbi:hypothetical protein GCM10027090_34890 [Sinomonas soli]